MSSKKLTRRKGRTQKQKQKQKQTQKQKTVKRRDRKTRRLKGGNYATDVTTETVDGIPVEEDVVVSMPGYPPMSRKQFLRLKEDLDRNGDDTYT
jgi:hypothetical protein